MTRRWPAVKLGELCEIQRGGSPRPIDQYITESPDGINWIKIGDVGQGEKYIRSTKQRIRPEGASRSRFVESGDFLLTNSMSFGRPYILRTSGCIHDGWLVLRYDDEQLCEDYLYHALSSGAVYDQFVKMASGAVVKNLNSDVVKGVEIPLPHLPEQRRIAAILDKADALRTKRREALAQLDRLAQAIFLEMFGDPATNSLNLPLMPLGSLGSWSSGGTPPRGESNYFEGSIPWFSSGELNEMYVSESAEHISELAVLETSAKKVQSGSLMLGMYDTAALKASIATIDCSCNQAIAFSRLNPNKAESLYVYYAIVIGREHFRRLQRGVRQKNLNLSMIRDIKIPAPAIARQKEFVNRIDTIQSLKATLNGALVESDAFFATLQHRAFCGEL